MAQYMLLTFILGILLVANSLELKKNSYSIRRYLKFKGVLDTIVPNVLSKIICASLCNEHKYCCSASYNKKRSLCQLNLSSQCRLLTESHFEWNLLVKDTQYEKVLKDSWIKVYTWTATYNQAIEICSAEGGRLVYLDTMKKLEAMRSYLKTVVVPDLSLQVYYVDGTRSSTESEWHFSDGSPITVFEWGSFEPSHHEDDLCLSLYTAEFLHGDTTCAYYDSHWNFGFICEKEF